LEACGDSTLGYYKRGISKLVYQHVAAPSHLVEQIAISLLLMLLRGIDRR
jgi:hypothetical protein